MINLGRSMRLRVAAVLLLATSSSALAQSTGLNDSGTRLFGDGGITDLVCTSETTASVTLAGELLTTGSVDSAVISRSIDGGERVDIGVIQPQDFQHDGRGKSAAWSDTMQLDNGTYSIYYCFTQSGAKGRLPKQTCTTPMTVTVDCAPEQNACADVTEAFFGNIVSNKELCGGKGGDPTIPVHLKANATGEVELTVNGPNGFVLESTMNRSGDSCVYQFQWSTRNGNHAGPGSYTFTARELDTNGNPFRTIATTTEALSCN
jgi:hypothetical protein